MPKRKKRKKSKNKTFTTHSKKFGIFSIKAKTHRGAAIKHVPYAFDGVIKVTVRYKNDTRDYIVEGFRGDNHVYKLETWEQKYGIRRW